MMSKGKIIIVHYGNLVNIPPIISNIFILNKLGYEVVLIDNGVNETLSNIFHKLGIRFYQLKLNEQGRFRKIINVFKYKKLIKNILQVEIQDNEHDLLWVEDARMFVILGSLVKKYRFILQISELYNEFPLYVRSIKKIIKSAKVVFIPEYNRAIMYKIWYGLKKMPIVLPNKPFFIPEKSDLDSLNDKYSKYLSYFKYNKVILYQGYLSTDRNLRTFASAIRELGSDYTFMIIGQGDINLINQLKKINPSIVYVGFVPSPDYFFFTSKAYIGILSYDLTSLNNAYCAPNKIWEYSKFGLPMIGNDVPGLKYTIYASGAGESADLESEDSIISAIKKISNNYAEYQLKSRLFFDSVNTESIIKDAISAL